MSRPTYPDVEVYLGGCDGNRYMVIARVCKHLRRIGQADADAFASEAMSCETFEDVIALTRRTVNVKVEETRD